MRKDEQIEIIARDCIFFAGNRPCIPQRREGKSCRCAWYRPRSGKILVLELSSPARVIRSQALLARLRGENPDSRIVYCSAYPDLLPREVDEKLNDSAASLIRLQMDSFDLLINLDMNRGACALANLIDAREKKGFYLRGGEPCPLDEDAYNSYLRVLFPRSAGNETVGGIRGMFQMCGLEYRRETPRLELPAEAPGFDSFAGITVGLDLTAGELPRRGCCPPADYWIELGRILTEQPVRFLLLGDDSVDSLNRAIDAAGVAEYPGPLDVPNYIRKTAACDLLVAREGIAAQAALALGRRVLLLRDLDTPGEINPEEYHDRCTVMEPQPEAAGEKTLADILPDRLARAVQEQIENIGPPRREKGFSPDRVQTINLPDTIGSAREKASRLRRRPI